MLRCCPNIAAQRRFNGPLLMAKARAALLPCALMPVSIPETFCYRKKFQLRSHDTAVTLAPRLAAIGADLMVETLRGLQAGTIHARPQDHAKATLAPILKKEDGRIDFQLTAQEILNRLRGFQPWPGAYTSFRGKNSTSGRRSQSSRPWRGLKSRSRRSPARGCGSGNCTGTNRSADSKGRNACRRPTSSMAISRGPARSLAQLRTGNN